MEASGASRGSLCWSRASQEAEALLLQSGHAGYMFSPTSPPPPKPSVSSPIHLSLSLPSSCFHKRPEPRRSGTLCVAGTVRCECKLGMRGPVGICFDDRAAKASKLQPELLLLLQLLHMHGLNCSHTYTHVHKKGTHTHTLLETYSRRCTCRLFIIDSLPPLSSPSRRPRTDKALTFSVGASFVAAGKCQPR